jgi:hypothetical protein
VSPLNANVRASVESFIIWNQDKELWVKNEGKAVSNEREGERQPLV